MSNLTMEEAQPCTLSKHVPTDYLKHEPSELPNPPGTPLSHIERFIVVCPKYFITVIRPQLRYFGDANLRFEGVKYHRTNEDQWTHNETNTAQLFGHKEHQEKLVFVPHMGRLYSCEHFDEITELIQALRDYEAKKVITDLIPGHSNY